MRYPLSGDWGGRQAVLVARPRRYCSCAPAPALWPVTVTVTDCDMGRSFNVKVRGGVKFRPSAKSGVPSRPAGGWFCDRAVDGPSFLLPFASCLHKIRGRDF